MSKILSKIQFEVKNEIDESLAKAIFDGLISYNEPHIGKSHKKDLMVVVRDDEGKVLGGIKAHTHWGWLYVSQLWVAEEMRGTGVGSKLMKLAEEEAKSRGCFASYLDTFSFQALEFYKKIGYEVFGELKEFPKGHQRFFLKKMF